MPDSLVPEGIVPEVTGGLILLDLADGSQVAVTVGKARWSLAMGARDHEPEWVLDRLPPGVAGEVFGEWWTGVAFHALDSLEANRQVSFRLIHVQPGGPRFRVEGGPPPE